MITVLTGDFGEFELKVLGTTLIISSASISAMACAAFMQRSGKYELGGIGIALTLISSLVLLLGMWAEMNSDVYWKATLILIVTAIAWSHALLLALPKLGEGGVIVQWGAFISIGLLALMINNAIVNELSNDGYYRVMALVAIAVTAASVMVPIMARIQKSESPSVASLANTHSLRLTQKNGDLYQDADGREYRVTPVEPDTQEDSEWLN